MGKAFIVLSAPLECRSLIHTRMRPDRGLMLLRHCLNDRRRVMEQSNGNYPVCQTSRLIHSPEFAQQVLRMNRLGQDLEIVSLRVGFFEQVSRGGLS